MSIIGEHFEELIDKLKAELAAGHAELERRTAWSNERLEESERVLDKALGLAEYWQGRADHYLQHALRERFLGVLHKRTIQLLGAELAKYQDERDSWAHVGKYTPIHVPESEALYPGEVIWPDQSQNIEAVRRAWRGTAEECGEALAKVAELEAELRKYEPSDGVMMQRLGDLQAIREAAELLEDYANDDSRAWPAVKAWLALPVVAQARKMP